MIPYRFRSTSDLLVKGALKRINPRKVFRVRWTFKRGQGYPKAMRRNTPPPLIQTIIQRQLPLLLSEEDDIMVVMRRAPGR